MEQKVAERVNLAGALAGHWLEVNPDGLTMGFFEAIQSGQLSLILDTVAGVIVASDLCAEGETVRQALARLRPRQFVAVSNALQTVGDIPKNA